MKKIILLATAICSFKIDSNIYEAHGSSEHAATISESTDKTKEDFLTIYKRLLKNCDKCKKLKDAYSIDDVKDTETFKELSSLDLETKNSVLKKALDDINIDDVKNNPNWTCLVVATLYSGADPNLRTNQGHTNLHMASFIAEHTNSYGIIELLLRLGADPNEKCIIAYPLEFSYDTKIKELLIKHGAYRKN